MVVPKMGDAPSPVPGGNKAARRPSLQPEAVLLEPKARISGASERRLSVTSLRLRADLEIWLMDAIPKLMGEESLDEEKQSAFLSKILFDKVEKSDDQLKTAVEKAFGATGGEKSGWDVFVTGLVVRIKETRASFTVARKASKVISVDKDGKEQIEA